MLFYAKHCEFFANFSVGSQKTSLYYIRRKKSRLVTQKNKFFIKNAKNFGIPALRRDPEAYRRSDTVYTEFGIGHTGIQSVFFIFSVLKELHRYLLKERTAQNILILFQIRRDLGALYLKLGCK